MARQRSREEKLNKNKNEFTTLKQLVEKLVEEMANLSLRIKAVEEKFEWRRKIIVDQFIPPAGESLD